MAPTTKKGSKKTKARPLRPARQTLVAKLAQTIANLRQEFAQSVQRENETLEHHTAFVFTLPIKPISEAFA